MDFYKKRQSIVRQLIRDRCNDSFADLSSATGIAAPTISRWFMEGEGRRNIGEEVARRLEKHFKLPTGALVMPEVTTMGVVTAWPFHHIKPERFDRLGDEEKLQIEGAVRSLLIDFEHNSESAETSELEGLHRTSDRQPPNGD